MPRIWRYRLASWLGVAGLAAATVLTGNPGSALADAGYGPPPPPAPVPGGYFRVVTSQTIGPSGGIIGPLRVDSLEVLLRIPRGDFRRAVQITITEPNVRALGHAGFRRYKAIGGVGILVQVNGSTYRGDFLKPLRLKLSSRRIHAADIVVVWNGTRFVIMNAREHSHWEKVRFDSEADQDFAVLRPAGFVLTRKAARAGTGASDAASAQPGAEAAVLAEAFLVPAGSAPPGIGVLTSA